MSFTASGKGVHNFSSRLETPAQYTLSGVEGALGMEYRDKGMHLTVIFVGIS